MDRSLQSGPIDRMFRVENPVHRGAFNVIIARKSDDNPE